MQAGLLMKKSMLHSYFEWISRFLHEISKITMIQACRWFEIHIQTGFFTEICEKFRRISSVKHCRIWALRTKIVAYLSCRLLFCYIIVREEFWIFELHRARVPARPASPNQLFVTVGHLNLSGNIVSVFFGACNVFFGPPLARSLSERVSVWYLCATIFAKVKWTRVPLCLSEGRGRKTLDSACHFSKRVICYHARSTCRSNWPVEYNVSNFRRYEMTVQCTSLDFCVALIWPCAHPGPFWNAIFWPAVVKM